MVFTMTKLHVGRLSEESIADVVRLAQAMQEESVFASLKFSAERVEHFAKQSVSLGDRNPVFLLLHGNDVVGFLSASLTPVMFSYDLGAAEEFLYVDPIFRGGRGAFLLVKAFTEWAETFGVAFIRASITTGVKSGAGRLYEYFGMAEVGTNHILSLPGHATRHSA